MDTGIEWAVKYVEIPQNSCVIAQNPLRNWKWPLKSSEWFIPSLNPVIQAPLKSVGGCVVTFITKLGLSVMTCQKKPRENFKDPRRSQISRKWEYYLNGISNRNNAKMFQIFLLVATLPLPSVSCSYLLLMINNIYWSSLAWQSNQLITYSNHFYLLNLLSITGTNNEASSFPEAR